MKTPTKEDIDDLVDADNDRDTNNEESEGKDQREERKKDLEPDHSETDERDQIENKELVLRKENQKEGDDDDLVNNDTDQETNNEESKETYWIEDSKKYDLESYELETDEWYQRKHPDLHKILDSQDIAHDDHSVDTNIGLESNVKKNTYLSTSTLVVRQLTENSDDMVDAEE